MKLRYTEEAERFRAECAAWLEAHAPTKEVMQADPRMSTAHMPAWAKTLQRAMFDDGWLVPGWPPEYGGRNASSIEQMIYFEELARRDVHRSQNPQGLSICTPSVLDHGNDEQKERWAIPTLKADITWCVGMSEPNAGSDLAALRTRAERRGDTYVVNGQKVWTSGAHDADWCMAFVRTDPDAPKHKGISVLVIDMNSPGIECRPLAEITEKGHADFNEVFFTDVEVPAAHLLGEENNGWRIANSSLGHERAMLWINQATQIERSLAAARRRLCPTDDPVLRDQLASLAVDLQAMWIMGYRTFAKAAKGKVAPEQSILKLFGSETEQAVYLSVVDSLGEGVLDIDELSGVVHQRPLPWLTNYWRSFGGTIAGGTSEIQRNIIAERVLGLPRS